MDSWGEKFALAADAKERADFDRCVELTIQVSRESGLGLGFGAQMVLQHYYHPLKADVRSLISAARMR